jgi:hypothetical protein
MHCSFRSTILYKDLKEECEKREISNIEEDRVYLSEKLGIQL